MTVAFLVAVRYTRSRWLVPADFLFGHDASGTPARYLMGALAVPAAMAVGAAWGLLARRLRSGPCARATVLALASAPALLLLIALDLGLTGLTGALPGTTPADRHVGTTSAAEVVVGVLVFAAYGAMLSLPVATPPSILAALLLEGWTRPEAQPQTGLARPEVRRWIFHGVLAMTAACATFAALRWR